MIRQGFDFLLKGGWIMWPLFACAIIAVAVMIERSWALRRAGRGGEELIDRVCALLNEGRADEAERLASASTAPVGAVIAAGLRTRDKGSEAVDQAMQAAALRQLPNLNRRLGWLDTIVTMAPLLGLLGTITGMIRSFQVVATASGASAAPAITGGVAEALIATAAGLAVAVTTLPVYNSLNDRVREITNQMEAGSTEVQSLLSGAAAAHAAARPAVTARATGDHAAHAPATTAA